MSQVIEKLLHVVIAIMVLPENYLYSREEKYHGKIGN